jgi:hypothetical protein
MVTFLPSIPNSEVYARMYSSWKALPNKWGLFRNYALNKARVIWQARLLLQKLAALEVVLVRLTPPAGS